MVYISVVGADRVPVVSAIDRAMVGYFADKRAAEDVLSKSGMPWTRCARRSSRSRLLALSRHMAKLPVVPVASGVRFQPVAADEVAQRITALALGEPQGLVSDLAGPRAYEMKDLVRGDLQAAGRQRLILPMRLAGKAARSMREGANLALDRAVRLRTWEELLADTSATERVSRRSPGRGDRRSAAEGFPAVPELSKPAFHLTAQEAKSK